MDYPDVTSWRPGEPEPSRAAHRPDASAHSPEAPDPPRFGPAASGDAGARAPSRTDDLRSLPPAVAPDAQPASGGPDALGWPQEDSFDVPPAKPRSLTPARLLTIAILIALAFLGGVYVQKQATYGYTPPAEAPKEFVPHGH